MNNLTTSYNAILNNDQNTYLYFKLGENKYAIKVEQIMEIIKLPLLDYPQKLPNNAIGLLKYNNFTINVLDLRFYLNVEVTPYNVSNQILIVKTDETIFGLLIDKAQDIFSLDSSNVEVFSLSENDKLIESIYKKGENTISIIDLNVLETMLKNGVEPSAIYIPSLFPKDDDSQYEFKQRNLILQEKNSTDLTTEFYSQDKFISFSLNENLYCINFKHVQEFLKNIPITKIPCDLDYIAGLIALKGEFITVINLNIFLKDSQDSNSVDIDLEVNNDKNNIIIIDCIDYKIGLLIDEIFGIISIPETLIKRDAKNQNKNILSEVLLEDKFYTILNMKKILSDERLFINDTV